MVADYTKREEIFQKMNRYFLILYLIITMISCYINLVNRDFYNLLQAILGLFILILPMIIYKISKFKLTSDVKFLFYFFSFCTQILGSSLSLYKYFPLWDKIVHFASGILITMIGFILFHILLHKKGEISKDNGLLSLIFCQSFNISIAALWEVYEYLLFVFFKIDAVNALTKGIHDSLQDMMVCMLGGFLILFCLIPYIYRGKQSFLTKTYEHLLSSNGYL